jgi:hypothetical protein
VSRGVRDLGSKNLVAQAPTPDATAVVGIGHYQRDSV